MKQQIERILAQLDSMEPFADRITFPIGDRVELYTQLLQCRLTALLVQEVYHVGEYLGSIQENLQHIDDMLREANNGETTQSDA